MAEAVDAPGALKGTAGPSGEPVGAIIDNRTDLPDGQIREAIQAQWVETAAMQFGTPTSFQLYATNNGSSMLSRTPFRTPSNIIDEIKLARQVADTDDDISAAISQAISTAFGDGMQNQHADERTVQLFNKICGPVARGGVNMDHMLKELYREYLIAASVTTISLFSRKRYSFTPSGTEQKVNAQLSTPSVGILPAENLRVITNDLFGKGELAYKVEDARLKDWLDEFFSPRTTAARKHQMRQENPVIAAVFTGTVEVDWNDQDMFSAGQTLYTVNQRMVHRTTMPKGATAYARPPMTANFALLEAKRLLNIMDYALLQGGTNYIVVAKQGSDALPAQQPEIDNLVDQVRSASRTGVLVGDHRISVEIITPKLDELLSPGKRRLLGRKLAMKILRVPEAATEDPGTEGAKRELEFTARTITQDRRDIKRHVEGYIYEDIVERNPSAFRKGAPNLWFPKIILSGAKDFFDAIMKTRDRGDIPRRWMVEALGFDYDAAVAQRRRELENGDDEVMIPGNVPFADPAQNPAERTSDGRPVGSGPSNGRPGGAPSQRSTDPAQRQRQLVPRRRGEPVRAYWDETAEQTLRVGELTASVLEEYPQHQVGRVTSIEREAVESNEERQSGPVMVVPVNVEYAVTELRAFRLEEGLSMIVGQRADGAIIARALCFREPQFELNRAAETAMRWGFAVGAVEGPEADAALAPPAAPRSAMDVVAAILADPDQRQIAVAMLGEVAARFQGAQAQQPRWVRKVVHRDENNNITHVEEIPVLDAPAPEAS